MAEIRAKKKLDEITARLSSKLVAEQVFNIFKNQQKYSNEKLFGFLQNNISSHILDGSKLLAQYDVNVKKNQKTPYEALVIMLNNATVIQSKPPIAEKPNLSKMSMASTFESPALSSTRCEQNPPEIVVSEIKEKLAQVTQQQNNTSRQSINLRPSLNTSGGTAVTKKQAVPSTPSLASVNPISSGTFVFANDILSPFHRIPKPIVGLPVSEQERIIITDMLYTLIGINADLIKPRLQNVVSEEYTMVNNWMESRRTNVEFDVDEQISDSVKDILKDILPLANLYCQLQCFIEYARARDSGQVLQALSEACGKLIEDYIVTISQLENMHNRRDLNLQKMLFLLRPIIQTMETVVNICIKLQEKNIRGGNVLTMLHDNISLFSGDKNSQKIIIHLTQKAAVPYMEILSLWIFKGIVHDPRHEFFVEDHEKELSDDCYLDDFWEKRFVLHSEIIPRFLEKQADMILRTGKYLNVIRECGKRITLNQSDKTLKFSHTDEQHYVGLINDAYAFASKSCMELIMDDYDLMGHLLSVKRYFLLQQGDFIVQYLDACEHELTKVVDDVMPIRLENLLELTLRMSSAKFDKYQDNLSTFLMPFDLVTQMSKITKSTGSEDDEEYDLPDTSTLSGMECFTFCYKTTWPISIVLHQMTISKYQIIFRQLFYCKYVENYLCRVWLGNNNAKKFDLETSEQYRAAFTLRQRMMNTIQNLEYYMMIEVIEPVWLVFMQQISKAKNIDEVLFYHEDFLDHCLKNCMLCNADILKVITKICNLCIEFCKFIEHKDFKPFQTFSERVSRFDSLFTQQTVLLLMKIQQIAEKAHSEKFVSLIHRINFNHFYNDKLTSTE